MCRKFAAVAVAGALFAGCAELNKLAALVQAPRFEQALDHQPEIRVMGAGSGLPIGGAGVRLWARVTNPNAFSLTLGTLKGRHHPADRSQRQLRQPAGAGRQHPPSHQPPAARLPARRDDRRRRRPSGAAGLRSDDAASGRRWEASSLRPQVSGCPRTHGHLAPGPDP